MKPVVLTAAYYLRLAIHQKNAIMSHTFTIARDVADCNPIMELAFEKLDLADSVIKALQDFKIQQGVRRKVRRIPRGHPQNHLTMELLRHLAEEKLELMEDELEGFEEWVDAYSDAWSFVRTASASPDFESSILSFE